MKKYTVYKATNKQNGKSYVGQTSNSLNNRRSWHYSNARHSNSEFAVALLATSRENFEWSVLAETDSVEEALRLEAHYIQFLDSINHGYNMKEGDRVPWNKGKKMSKEYCDKLRGSGNGMWGKTHTPEVRERASDRMSKCQLGDKNVSAKTVYCYELDKTWTTVKECSKDTGINKDSISNVCRGVRKTAGGYHFKYV